MNEYERQLPKLTRSVDRAPWWRARWKIALVSLPVGVALNVITSLGVWPWYGMTIGAWLALAAWCRVVERWHVRRIDRIMRPSGWRVARVVSSEIIWGGVRIDMKGEK